MNSIDDEITSHPDYEKILNEIEELKKRVFTMLFTL
jgi:hypothetical protein